MRFIALMFALLASPLAAHKFTVGDIDIDHPYSFANHGEMAAGYMEITNSGEEDRLLDVRTDVSHTELHKSEIIDGVMKMRPAGEVVIATGEKVIFEPGGLHVMFMGLKTPFKAGDLVSAVLVFEKAGEVEVIFKVQARAHDMNGEDHNHDHEGHTDHGDHDGHKNHEGHDDHKDHSNHDDH